MRIARSVLVVALVGALGCGGGKPKPPPNVPSGSGSGSAAVTTPPADATKADVQMVAAVPGGPRISGTIKDAKTKELLSGVTIVLSSPALQGEQTTITDENGNFSMMGLPAGKYTLTAYYADATATASFDVKDESLTKINLAWDLTPKAGGEVVTIDATPITFPSAMKALEAGAMDVAYKQGKEELAKSASSRLHGLLAIARYGSAVEAFMFTGLRRGGDGDDKNVAKRLRSAVATFAADMEAVQQHLAAAAKDPAFSLELCVACMAAPDSHFMILGHGAFDIERDKKLKELPEGDPRRRPTYRFDHGDLAWARAMVSFQQGIAVTALAYDWSFIDQLMADHDAGKKPTIITIKLAEPAKVAKAKELFLAALAASDEARTEYVAETDDDREWVPSPKQKNYAAPLAVDAGLYKTWEVMVKDVRDLVNGQTGISLPAVWKVAGVRRGAPTGFVDLGAMLSQPTDIVIDIDAVEKLDNEKNPKKQSELTANVLKQLIGNGYKDKMKASPLTDRVVQLKKDMDKKGGDQLVEDKLKYLFWFN